MQPFPHRYQARAGATVNGDVTLESGELPALTSAAPAEFGGPGDRWSPETLLVAAVADCFVLTFRAIAAASGLSWTALACDAVGSVERIERVTQFTKITVRARLEIPLGTDQDKASRLLQKSEQSCLVSNSLKAPVHFEAEVQIERTAA